MLNMSPEPTSRTPALEVEGALLEGAERLLERHGAAGLTVRRMAAEAGVAPMGVYSRFGGKRGVLDALLARGFDQLAAALDAAEESDPLGALAGTARRYRSFAKEHPALYGLMFDRAIPGWQPSPGALGHAAASFGRLARRVSTAMATGALAEGDPDEVAQRLWSASHGVVSLELRGLGFIADIDTHYDLLIQSLLAGLAHPPHRPAPGGGSPPLPRPRPSRARKTKPSEGE